MVLLAVLVFIIIYIEFIFKNSQIALVDTLYAIGLRPDGILGHSVGELACAYVDGGLTSEEAILVAYHRGRCVMEANLPPGAMAAVGLTWEEAKER